MKGLVSVVIIILLLVSICIMNVYAKNTNDIVVPDGYRVYYTHICTLENKEERIDYLLLKREGEALDSCHYWKYFGDYVIRNTTGEPLEYFVYLVDQNEIITLTEAIENEECCIDSIFTDYGLGELLGDMDDDMKLTILDATIIQRCIAELSEFPSDDYMDGYYGPGKPNDYGWSSYISDMNRDGLRSILDATAIQQKQVRLY